jgi:hypothetical protein
MLVGVLLFVIAVINGIVFFDYALISQLKLRNQTWRNVNSFFIMQKFAENLKQKKPEIAKSDVAHPNLVFILCNKNCSKPLPSHKRMA